MMIPQRFLPAMAEDAKESFSSEPGREKETVDSIVQDEKELATSAKQNDENLESQQESPSKIKDSLSNDSNKPPFISPEPLPFHPTETTIDTAHTTEETLVAEASEDEQQHIFDPSAVLDALDLPDIHDQALISALQSLQVDDEEESDDFEILPLEQGDVLEELQVDPADRELLPFLQDFSNVFRDEDEQEGVVDDNDAVALLEENLNSLAIGLQEQEEEEESMEQPQQLEQEDDDLRDENGNFPWYMLCRPCEPGTEDPLSIEYQHFQKLSQEEQLQLSLLAMAENEGHFLDNDTDDGQEYSEQQEVYDESFQTFIVSRRPQAVQAAISYTLAFGTGLYQPPMNGENPSNERTCFGHRETIYSCKFSSCGKYLVTASQDATVRVWDVATNALLSTLTGHNKDYECLRTTWAPTNWAGSNDDTTDDTKASFIASGGADGIVKIWLSSDPSTPNSWECVSTLDHGKFEARLPLTVSSQTGQVDTPQIYALQFINHWQGLASKDNDPSEKNSFLLTSSDDYVHLWDMDVKQEVGSSEIRFSEVFSIRFTAQQNVGGGVTVCTVTSGGLKVPPQEDQSNVNGDGKVAFGGERNPENTIYVFDASYCPGNGLLGVALADGSLRLVNGRGICVSILSLPGCNSHLTSFTWDSTGSRLASCVATGHLILWKIHGEDENGRAAVSCAAVLEGGHVQGRPLFGARYCGVDNEDLIVSWGVDGRLCLWDSESHGQIHAPISTLIARQDYPIYAVDIYSSSNDNTSTLSRLAVGGGMTPGFMGVPLYLYDVKRMQASQDKKANERDSSDAQAKAE